jgi:hypothetical protein
MRTVCATLSFGHKAVTQGHIHFVTLIEVKFPRQFAHKKVPNQIRQSPFIFAKLTLVSLEPVYAPRAQPSSFPIYFSAPKDCWQLVHI